MKEEKGQVIVVLGVDELLVQKISKETKEWSKEEEKGGGEDEKRRKEEKR